MNTHDLLFPPGATRHDWALDGVLTVLLALTSTPVYLAGHGTSYIVANLLVLLPLIWRRHSPLISLGGVAVASFIQLLMLDQPTPSLVAVPIVIYTVARWVPGQPARLSVVIGGIGSVLGPMRWLLSATQNVSVQQLVTLSLAFMLCIGLVITPYAIGRRVREADETQELLVDQADERHRALLIEREQQSRLVESQVRTQLARELHDIIAHSLSIMIVQAEGGRALAAKRPTAALEALTTIAETGRESLTEMRRILKVLRSEPNTTMETLADFTPTPQLSDISDLVTRTSDRAHLHVNGRPPYVSQLMGLTVYRIVQEALTNFLKHAGPTATAQVTLTYGTRTITVDVVDDGAGVDLSHEPGLGLRGMNERVTAMGGRLITRPRPVGGFQVTAILPLGGSLGDSR